MPILDRMPDLGDTPQGFSLVLREIDRYLGSRDSTLDIAVTDLSTIEVKEVARLLADKKAVLIGGSRRHFAHDTLRTSLGLKELLWIETREHEPIESFEPYIARPGVSVVLLAIRWSSHSFGGVKRFCDRHGKPLVRLPGGYNPNQVAVQILAQCSGRLGGE